MSELPITPTPQPNHERNFTLIEGEKQDTNVVSQLHDENLSDGAVEMLAKSLVEQELTPTFFRETNRDEQATAILNHILFSSTILRGTTTDEEMIQLEKIRQKAVAFWNPDSSSRSESISDDRLEMREKIADEMDRSEHTNIMRLSDQLRTKLSSRPEEMLKAHRMVVTMLLFSRDQ